MGTDRPRGRFAPSPTGALHLGNARTALLSWLQIRAAGGRYVLRVEDLDRNRVRPGMMERQLAELRWLGLDWDEGPDVGGPHAPYLQSERAERYEAALSRLRAAGSLYPCRCSRREIAAAASAPHGPRDEGPRYPGTCRPEAGGGFDPGEERCALRFRVPEGPVAFHDRVHGPVTCEPERETGDFVVRRKDGIAAYQLAVVVDDAEMGITEVLRGEDLLSSTGRQILLYRALGAEPPTFTHVPLVLGARGSRLSKRDGAVTLSELRRKGADPSAVVGWLAWSCGLAGADGRTAPYDLVPRFDPERLLREPSRLEGSPWGSSLPPGGGTDPEEGIFRTTDRSTSPRRPP